MLIKSFQVDFNGLPLSCDWQGSYQPHPLVLLHGAGQGTRDRFFLLRQELLTYGVSSLALDFIGHGQTGGSIEISSLESRTQQALKLINESKIIEPLRILGSSMGAYNAIKITETHQVESLVLFVPGVYSPESYHISFGPNFSKIIRQDRNWETTDAWNILSHFTGNLLIVAAANDQVIPREIPERLYESAKVARSRELYWVADSPHLLVHYLCQHQQELKVVAQKIKAIL